MSDNLFIEIKLKCIFLFNQTTAIVMVKKSTKVLKKKIYISTSHSVTHQMYLNSVLNTFSSLFSLYYFASLSV